MATHERMTSPERPSEILFTADMIQDKVDEMAGKITDFYSGKGRPMPPMLALLDGARPFALDLQRRIDVRGFQVPVLELHAKSYQGEESGGHVVVNSIKLGMLLKEHPPRHGEVLLLDDVLDSGITLDFMNTLLQKDYGLRRVDVAVLVNKFKLNREKTVRPRFQGFQTNPDHWIFGYGMDMGSKVPGEENKGRDLPYIARFTD